MIDLRKSTQTLYGFYIWKKKDGYSVGKNGTSNHTLIKRGSHAKKAIIKWIREKRGGL